MTSPSTEEDFGGPERLGVVHDLLDRTVQEVERHERADLATRLRLERDRLATPTCTVLVIGEFNKGKSSMINALLNVRVCATDADVATAVPTLVRWASERRATVRHADGTTEAVDAERVEGLVRRPVDDHAAGTERAADLAASIEIGVPRALLRDGLILVDTPGMGGGLHSAHGAATLRALAGTEAVVFVTDAGQELSQSELELVRRATDLCPRTAVALTKIDFHAEWRRIADLDRGHLRRSGVDVRLLPLSAPLRHYAVRRGDHRLVAESGFPQLAQFLRDAADGVRVGVAAGAVAAAHSALSQLVAQLAAARDTLVAPNPKADRLAEWTAAKQRAEQLRGNAARWQMTLADRIGDMASAVDYDITQRLRAVRHDAAARLAETEPRAWLDIEPWLYHRTNSALADHLGLIRDEADLVANDVADRFGEAAWELRVQADVSEIGLAGTGAGEEIGLAAVAATRASRVELGIAAARGSSVALVAAHAVGLFVGLTLPVTLPFAAVLAAMLGRVTIRSARTAQLRGLRAEAERAVAAYLDEIELRARRDSRDAVRRVQQHLREVFTRHAAELHTSLARNVELLARSDRDEEHRGRELAAELGRADAELQRLRDLTARAAALVEELLGRTDTR